MTGCMAELFFWTLGNNVSIPDHIIGCHSYHDKDEKVSNNPEHPYLEERQLLAESQDITWTPRNKRPDRLRDTLKDVEALLTQYKCIKTHWRSKTVLQLILNNGCLISYQLKNNNADIEKLLIDKSLIGKLSSDFISDAVLSKSFFLFSYPDRAKVDYVYFQKMPPTGDSIKKLEKISSWDPKIYQFPIPGPTNRRVSKHFSYCSNSDLLLAWWSLNPEDACPWSPLVSDREQSNLILLALSGPRLEVVSFTKTEYTLLGATFSRCHTRQIITVELISSRSGEATVEVATYQIVSTKIHRSNAVSLVLPSMVSCYCVHPTQNKVLFGCLDGTLFMYDELGLTTYSTQANIVASCMAWHTNGSVIFVASSVGNIQIFDLALNHLKFQLVGENFSFDKVLKIESFFRNTTLLQDIMWNSLSDGEEVASDPHFLLLVYNRGPLAVLKLYLGLVSTEGLSVLELIKEYIKHRQLNQATSLLCSLRWDIDGPTCYAGLSAITNHLLRLPLNAERESYLEQALGMFYSPKESLTDAAILEYRDPICRLARRFFHLLLRYSRFDKAFLLAVDIGSEDLFMDIHYAALDCKEMGLAEVAKKRAEEIRDTYINSSDEDYDSQESLEPDLCSYDDYSSKSSSVRSIYYSRLKRSSSLRKNATSPGEPLEMKRHYTKEKSRKDIESQIDYSRDFDDSARQAEYSCEDIGNKLANELIQDYTAALMDAPPHEGNNSHVFTYL